MTRYRDIALGIARRIHSGDLASGTELPSVRELAREHGTTASTVTRAYRHLADGDVIVLADRRPARVPPTGRVAAARFLDSDRVFRLAASDDPALRFLLDAVGHAVTGSGVRGSFHALRALERGDADGAAIHLRDRAGVYNEHFGRALLRHRDPHLIHLWRREQGFLLPPGNPDGIRTAHDVGGLRIARRETGAGTKVLLDQLLIEAGTSPEHIAGPELASHFECGLAVVAGIADTALGLRSAARDLGLDFVHVAWEPYELVLPAESLPPAQPLVAALARADLRTRINALGGYDLSLSGQTTHLTTD
ncbi:helix-turn-helix transcriptional regulator [Pseudonocardia tropica]|uniref:Helix-turn-helix transcriptional regulator n=1 Tax=Pseudonocardia tropica TaxID=681289 RepID=A0ABV1K3P6_9PSEU|nr:helix-turn-helix transcriptional regulator [Pseudonocardia alni]WFG47363.1 helix-turn-helix transcriptional regulator [Pseudonocardia alni]